METINILINAMNRVEDLIVSSNDNISEIKFKEEKILATTQSYLSELFSNDIVGRILELKDKKGNIVTGDVLKIASDYTANLFYEWTKEDSNIDENVLMHLSFLVSSVVDKLNIIGMDSKKIYDYNTKHAIYNTRIYIETNRLQ